MSAPHGRLADNIVYFARALRAAGMPVGPGAVLDALEALTTAGVGTRDDFYWTLHAVFVKRHEHSVLFAQAFDMFFRSTGALDILSLPTLAAESAAGKPGARRIEDALYSGGTAPSASEPWKPMHASPFRIAKCCSARTLLR